MHYARLDLSVDVSALLQQLEQLAEPCWLRHVNQAAYQGDWQVMPLRCLSRALNAHPIQQAFAIQQTQDDWCSLAVVNQLPAVEQLFNQLQCPLYAARLMLLQPGSDILPHRDPIPAWAAGEARLHFPLVSHPDVNFFVADQRVPMAVGECWYINAGEQHQVKNNSPIGRLHLVLDVAVNDWLESRLLDTFPLTTTCSSSGADSISCTNPAATAASQATTPSPQGLQHV